VLAADRLEQIDAFLRQHLEQIPIPGFSAVVVEGDEVIFARGYGVERLGTSRALTAKSSIAIGSQTKSLTAVAVMQLVERGEVDLEAPVTRYLPWFRLADGRQDEVTVRTLLHNSSGIPSRDRWLHSRDRSEDAIERGARALASEPLVRAPGKSFEYSNENWSLLGLIVSQVSGLSYSAYMQERVLEPMGMARSTTALELFDDIGVLYGHSTGIEKVRPAAPRFLAEALPAGSELRSTAEDMGRYLVMLLNGGEVGGRRVLEPESVAALFEPGISFTVNMPEMGVLGGEAGYGMGWVEVEADGRTVSHHGGDAIVMGSWTMLDRERRLGVSLLYNGPVLHEYRFPSKVWVVNNLLHLAAGEPTTQFGLPREADPTANDFDLPRELLGRYAGTYLSPQGLRAEISARTGDGDLVLQMTAGDIEYEYELDFVSESAVVLRNLSGASLAGFLLTPDGEVTGLEGVVGGVYRRQGDEEMRRLRRVRSPTGRLSFVLPQGWSVSWQGADFEARGEGGTNRVLVGGAGSPDDAAADSRWQAALERGAEEAVETMGGRVWRKLVWAEGQGDGATQGLLAVTDEAGSRLFFHLTAPAGELTSALREVLFPLLSDLDLRPPEGGGA
jgi:CubicO group peptidase (beta-lactamase class C family)